jgi:site-specific recombinase XerD
MKIYQRYFLIKRNNGFYYLGYDIDGKRRWKTTKCKKKVEAMLFLKYYTGEEIKTEKSILLSQLVTELGMSKSVRRTTFVSYALAVKLFIKLIGDKELGEYKRDDLERFKQFEMVKKLSYDIEKTLSHNTINVYMRAIMSVFSYGVKNNYLKNKPFSFSQLVKVSKITPVFISQEEFQKLLQEVDNETLKDYFIISGNTGMRLSELINLKWLNCNFEKKQIVVTNTDEFTTKSGKSRVIPMNDLVYNILSKRLEQRNGTEFVFCDNKGCKLLQDYISKNFKRYVIKANLNSKYHIHTLRHSFASWLALKEVPIFSIQQLLGHASVNTTLQYAHLSSSVLHSAVNKI